jgi:L-cysteine/cystine lyase
MDLTALRESIPATRDSIYMNTGWSGPAPAPVVAKIHEVLEVESTSGPASLEGLRITRAATEGAQQAVAGLLKAGPDEVLLTHGTTEGVHIVLYGLPWQAGDELVTCDLEHSAIATPAAVLEERHGVNVKRLEVPTTASEAEMVAMVRGALTPRTRIVALSHIQYTCGLRMPIRAICDAAHEAGALVLADGAQTAGHIELDMNALGVDFYAISGQKWLLGPQATGALYVKHEHARIIEPLFLTHTLADSRSRPQAENAGPPNPLGRFRVTSQSPALLAGLATAIGLLQEIGIDAIEAHSNRLARRMIDGIRSIGDCALTGATDPGVSSGLVTVAIEGWEPRQIVEALWERWRIAGRAVNHPPAVRFSNAGFNTEEEVDRILEALATLAKQRPEPAIAAPAVGPS